MKFSTLITLTVASTLAVLSRSVDASIPRCSGKCPSVIAPICAQNAAGVTHTFVNSCELSQSNCLHPTQGWTMISDGYCPNDSNLQKRGIFDGPSPVAGCPKTCPAVIQRICGQNNAGTQVTFINSCHLFISQCQHPTQGWTQISDGYCPNDADLQKRSIWDQPIPNPGCSQDCPAVISPVCAQNQLGQQKTFVNSCRMTVANCEYPAEQWSIVERKTCAGDLN